MARHGLLWNELPMTDFEPVTKGAENAPNDLFVSVHPTGVFYIPNRVYDHFFGDATCVAVGVNAETAEVALRPTDDCEGENVYHLSENRGYGRRFTSKATLTTLGVVLGESVRVEPTWDDEMEAVVVSLAEHQD